MIMDAAAAVAELLETGARLSRWFGENPEYARAGGGNSSVKHDGTLYIKPSGVSLASIRPESLMPLAMGPLLSLAGADAAVEAGSDPVMRVAMAARLRDEGALRPSVECVFHALIPRRFVIHTHPTTVNALTCARDGEAIARRLFGDEVLWIPYTDPGLPLAREIARRRVERGTGGGSAEVTLLQNHGLIVAGDDETAIVERSEAVVAAVRDRVAAAASGPGTSGPSPSAATSAAIERLSRVVGAVLGGAGDAPHVVFDASPDAAWVAGTREGRALVEGGPLTPDQIVYAGSWPLWLDAALVAGPDRVVARLVRDEVSAHVARTGEAPVIVVAEGLGVLATGVGHRQADTARQLYLDAVRVGRGALALGGVRVMAEPERAFIEDWEAEAYRRGLDAQ
jgi:rhamnulokinase